MGSNPVGALEMSHVLIVIVLETCLSENFLVVVSNGFAFRVHVGWLFEELSTGSILETGFLF